jgi:hypothetical protein
MRRHCCRNLCLEVNGDSSDRYTAESPLTQNELSGLLLRIVEHSLRLDRRTRGILIDLEVRRECAHKGIDVPVHQCYDKVEIAGHARFAVVPKRK